MKLFHDKLPRRCDLPALRCMIGLLAGLTCAAAGANTYTLTTRTEGSAASFQLPGFFPQGDLNGSHSFELTVTSVFDSANVLSSPDKHRMEASNATLLVLLDLDGQIYSMEATGLVSSQILLDTDGNGGTTKRYYNAITFDPATYGDLATIQQYVFVGADHFPINSVLDPATAFYADPAIKGFSIYDWEVASDGNLNQLGDAAGRAGQFNYQLALTVPEPATYAMFGAGLALVGWAARRRQA